MKRKISSDLTPLYKNLWIFYLIGLGIILFVTDIPPSGKAGYSLFWIIGIFILWGFFWDLRTVEIDAFFLYVSDGRLSSKIPFSEIKSIRQEFTLARSPVIVIELKNKTEFGAEIIFMPYHVFGMFFRQHPVINQLKQLAKITNQISIT